MALFSKKPRTPTADDIVRLRSRRDVLAKQLKDAETAAQVKQRAVEQLLIEDGEPAVLARAQDALADTERQARSLIGALGALDCEIAGKETEIASAADKKQRAATVAQLDAYAEEVNEAAAAFISGARQFAEATGKIAGTIWEIERMHNLASGLVSDVTTASDIAETLIRDHAKSVSAGTAPATLRRPEPVSPPMAAPPTPTRTIFTIKPILWTDHASGFQLTKPAFAQATLSPELAERAIRLNAAWDIADHRVAGMSRSIAPKHVAPSQCTNLDPDGGEPVEPAKPDMIGERVLHSAFDR